MKLPVEKLPKVMYIHFDECVRPYLATKTGPSSADAEAYYPRSMLDKIHNHEVEKCEYCQEFFPYGELCAGRSKDENVCLACFETIPVSERRY